MWKLSLVKRVDVRCASKYSVYIYRQQLSALKHEHLKEIKQIKSTLSGLRCGNCEDAGN